MNFVVIPFLLAVDLMSNDDAWYNGPEYSFSVSASTISNITQENSGSFLMGSTLQLTLRCRPIEPDHLNCHFRDVKIGRLRPKKFFFSEALPNEETTYRPFGFSETHFEIRFDRDGIAEYIFEKDEKIMSSYLVDMFRMIANQLSVATNLDREERNIRSENFSMGECPTNYEIYYSYNSHCKKKKFNLVSLTDLKLYNERVLHIEREREVEECLPRDLCYFGMRHTYDVVPSDYTAKLVSSSSHAMIQTDCFISETLNVVHIYNEDKKNVGSALDRIQVSLESVDPARGSLQSISHPTSVDVIIRSLS